MKGTQPPLRLTARGEAVRDALATTLTLAGIVAGVVATLAIFTMIGH